MRSLQLSNHLSNEQLIEKLSCSRGSPTFSRWQILYLIQVAGLCAAAIISPLVCLSKPSIYKIVEGYNKQGPSAVPCKARGGRRHALLSMDAEAQLFITLEEQAAKGLIKTANDIRHSVESKVGKAVSDDFLWDLLHRNGWKKKMPRPHHPKRDVKKQEEFKKNCPKSWKLYYKDLQQLRQQSR
jgi:transposase